MGRATKYKPLPDQAYDPRVTDIDNPVSPPIPATAGTLDAFRNRNIRNTTPIQLIAGNAIRVLPANPRRTGLLIQNKDSSAALYIGYGNSADANGLSIPAGGYILEDFTTPSSEVYLFATANVQAVVIETSRGF